jgi:serine/threonine-protein kinase
VSLKKLGRYELVRVLGKGAMGIVYEGKDPNLDRRVAIKTVKVENLSEEAAAEYEHRFRTEARSAARLQHPNIVSVYDSDRDDDIAFLVMEYIQGDDLKHHLDRGTRYSLEQSLKIIRDLLSALDYAHKQGIVHRDIKPANLLIEPSGRVKLTDFGVARIQDSSEATRTQGSMVGTLKYMSPEQVQGQKIDSRADLFSVGVVLYQLLTDKRPFDGENDFSIIHQIIGHNPPPPSSIDPRLPTAIDAVVARALAKNRDERFATGRDFAAALQSAIRRAEDQTIVPPADPRRSERAAAPTTPGGRSVPGSLTSPGGLTTPGAMSQPGSGTNSTVTQEVELVYWKDIKDSTDPDEFHSFLERFPAGIYADLARRRLRKLAGGPDGTVVGAGSEDNDLEATRLRTDASRPLVVPKDAAAAGAAAAAGTAPRDWTATVVEARPGTLAGQEAGGAGGGGAVPGQGAAQGAGQPGARPGTQGAAVPQPAKAKTPVGVIAAVAAIAVVAAAATFVMMGKKSEVADAALAAASAPASAASGPSAAVSDASAALPAASTATVAASGPAERASESSHAAASAAAAAAEASKSHAAKPVPSAPRRVASRPVKPAPVQEEPPKPIFVAPVTPQPQPQASRPLPVPPPVTSGDYARVDECGSKMFLAKELCLAEHCDKPGARNHPLCVKRRDEIRLREESKVRQGPQQSP